MSAHLGCEPTIEAVHPGPTDVERGQPADSVEVKLLGRPGLMVDGRQISDELVGRQEGLVFLRLAMHHGQWVGRDDLIDKVWEKRQDEGGELPPNPGTALTKLVFRTKEAVGRAAVIKGDGHGNYRLSLPSGSTVDTELVMEDAKSMRCAFSEGEWSRARDCARSALRRMTGRLGEGLEAKWLEEEQLRFEDLTAEALNCVASASQELGELDEARDAAAALWRRDKLCEEVCLLLMEIEHARGHTGAALAVHEELKRELTGAGVLLSPEVEAMRQQITRRKRDLRSRPPQMSRGSAIDQTSDPIARSQSAQHHAEPEIRGRAQHAAALAMRARPALAVLLPLLLLTGLLSLSSASRNNSSSRDLALGALKAFAVADWAELARLLAPGVAFEEPNGPGASKTSRGKAALGRLMERRSRYGVIRYRTSRLVVSDGRVEYNISWSGTQNKPRHATIDELPGHISADIENGRITLIIWQKVDPGPD